MDAKKPLKPPSCSKIQNRYSVESIQTLCLRIVRNSFRIHLPVCPFRNRHMSTMVPCNGEFRTNGKAHTELITGFIASVISQLSEVFERHVTFLRYCGIDVKSVGRIIIKAGFADTGFPLYSLRPTRTFE